jgi:hypothetical protein
MWGRYPPHLYLPPYWWPRRDLNNTQLSDRRDHNNRFSCSHFTTVQHCSQTCTVHCKGNGHNWRQNRRPTSQLPAAPSSPTSQVSAGSSTTGFAFLRFPRKLIPERRSWLTTTLAWLRHSHILNYGWLPLSLNLGLLRDHAARNPSSQDTDDDLQTLMASNIALRLKKQVSGAIASTHSDPPARQPRPYISAPLRFQVFHHHLRLHRPDHAFRSPPTLSHMLQRLRNNLRGGWCGNLAQGDGLVTLTTSQAPVTSAPRTHLRGSRTIKIIVCTWIFIVQCIKPQTIS